MLYYNLKQHDMEDAAFAHSIIEAFRQTDEVDEQIFDEWPRELTFYHGTGWMKAQAIQRDGFQLSVVGRLGPGVYVGRSKKALKFARDKFERHGETQGGLLKVVVTIRRPKFLSNEDPNGTWRTQGYDACRAERTLFSPHMEWCIANPADVRVVNLIKVPIRLDTTELTIHKPSYDTVAGVILAESSGWLRSGEGPEEGPSEGSRLYLPPQVNSLVPGSLAERAGLRVGMTLVAVNGEDVFGVEGGLQLLRLAMGDVRLTVHAESTLNPPAATGDKQADAVAMENTAAIAFGLRLARDADLRLRCESKRIFKDEANRWKEEQQTSGRVWKLSARQLVWRYSRLSSKTVTQRTPLRFEP